MRRTVCSDFRHTDRNMNQLTHRQSEWIKEMLPFYRILYTGVTGLMEPVIMSFC
jgi:hypothetical protein